MKKLTLLIWVTVFLSSLYCFSQDTAKLCSPIAPGAVDVYHLPPFSGNLPKDISWMTDWVSIPSSGGWYGQQIENSCRMHIDANFSTWHNKIAVRVEVNPGDDPLALNVNSERAEMAFAQDQSGNMIQESPSSGVQYYATSYYFPAGWLGQQLPWSAFYPTDCSSGSGNQCNSWSAVLQFHGGSFIWGSLNAAQTSIGGAEHYIFNGNIFRTNDSIALGSWTDFVFRIDWGSGSYSIYRRDQGQTEFTQVLAGTTAVPAGSNIYLKQGLYRGGAVNGRTDVFWIGPTVRGKTFSAVEQQAFGTNIGTGITEIGNADSAFDIYPNPFTALTIIRTENSFKNATLTIYNLFGQEVKQVKNISGQTITIYRDNLLCGLYFIYVRQNNELIKTCKIVIIDK